MIDNHEFSLDVGDPAPTDEPAVTPPPKVVIEYRDRGLSSLLIPPLLILLLVLVILSSRRGTPILAPAPTPVVSQPESRPVVDRDDEAAVAGPLALAPGQGGGQKAPFPVVRQRASALPELPDLDDLMPSLSAKSIGALSPVRDPGVVGPNSGVKPKGEAVAKGEPTAPAEHSEEAGPGPDLHPGNEAEARPDSVARVRKIDRPLLLEEPPSQPVAAAPAPPPAPEATKEAILDDIREEAARKQAEIQKINELKPHVRQLEIARVLKKAEEGRSPFHKSLRELIRSRRPEIGRHIEALCIESGRDTLPEIRRHIGKILATTYARSPLKVKVEMMRSWGLPEAMVFDYVANHVSRSVGSRGGPRDGDEVGMRAARMLLAMPPAHASGRSVAGAVPVSGSAPSQRAN